MASGAGGLFENSTARKSFFDAASDAATLARP
jgi:hypothetical protein